MRKRPVARKVLVAGLTVVAAAMERRWRGNGGVLGAMAAASIGFARAILDPCALNRPGNQFFARTTFTQNENGDVCRTNNFCLLQDVLEFFAVPDDLWE